MKTPKEDTTLGQVLVGIFQSVRGGRTVGREARTLAAEGGPALLAELGEHFAGWISVQIRATTGGDTDLGGAQTLEDLNQRAAVALALLDEQHPDRAAVEQIAHHLSNARRSRQSPGPADRGWVVRDLAQAVHEARKAAMRQEGPRT